MEVNLNYEQRARIELIAIHTGKSAERVLVDAAQFLFHCAIDYYPPPNPHPSQQFLPEDEMEARLAQILPR